MSDRKDEGVGPQKAAEMLAERVGRGRGSDNVTVRCGSGPSDRGTQADPGLSVQVIVVYFVWEGQEEGRAELVREAEEAGMEA